jgi:hypothetical protein
LSVGRWCVARVVVATLPAEPSSTRYRSFQGCPTGQDNAHDTHGIPNADSRPRADPGARPDTSDRTGSARPTNHLSERAHDALTASPEASRQVSARTVRATLALGVAPEWCTLFPRSGLRLSPNWRSRHGCSATVFPAPNRCQNNRLCGERFLTSAGGCPVRELAEPFGALDQKLAGCRRVR